MTRIQKWREEYEKSPNGWPVCSLVGIEYMDKSQKRKKVGKNA